eukprot:scaffold626049_cov40-Prasinocladus_malaysianus.AAC.1
MSAQSPRALGRPLGRRLPAGRAWCPGPLRSAGSPTCKDLTGALSTRHARRTPRRSEGPDGIRRKKDLNKY